MPADNRTHFDVKIGGIGLHFLFLPVFFAIERKFFGLVPENYTVSFISPETLRTDADVFNFVAKRPEIKNELRFGLCDPMYVYDKKLNQGRYGEDAIGLLASIVSNSGFWAVDTRDTKITRLQDLADNFDRIICYHEGTTSHRIASHIVSLRREKKIELVQALPSTEVRQYCDNVLGSQDGVSTVLLTPDILNIEAVTRSDKRVRIELALASAPEYTSNLVSVLIGAESTICETQHANLISGMLSGIQLALQMARAKRPEVIRSAASYFRVEASTAEAAMRSAVEYGMFASHIEISRAIWDRTFEGSIGYFSPQLRAPSEIQAASTQAYDRHVSPHKRFWADANTQVSEPLFRQFLAPQTEKKSRLLAISHIVFASMSITLAIFSWIFPNPPIDFSSMALEAIVALLVMMVVELSFSNLKDGAFVAIGWIVFLCLVGVYNVGAKIYNLDPLSQIGIVLAVIGIAVAFNKFKDWNVRKPKD